MVYNKIDKLEGWIDVKHGNASWFSCTMWFVLMLGVMTTQYQVEPSEFAVDCHDLRLMIKNGLVIKVQGVSNP